MYNILQTFYYLKLIYNIVQKHSSKGGRCYWRAWWALCCETFWCLWSSVLFFFCNLKMHYERAHCSTDRRKWWLGNKILPTFWKMTYINKWINITCIRMPVSLEVWFCNQDLLQSVQKMNHVSKSKCILWHYFHKIYIFQYR